MTLRASVASVSLLGLILASCGGGGGSGNGGKPASTPPPPATPVTPVSLPDPMPAPSTSATSENFNTSEFRNSSAAIGSNAIGAWQQGASGKGVTIGFVDTGIVPTLSDFAGRIHPLSRDFNGSRPMDDVWGHGTAVAGIASAARDGSGMMGIAFESTIFMAKADEGCPDQCSFPSEAVVKGIDAAISAGTRVINLSIGGSSNEQILEAARRAVNSGIILVIGAGNSGGSSPTELARDLGKMAPNQVIIVGALGISNPDGSVNYDLPAQWTTAAGVSQAHFLTAPGWLNSATYFRGGGIDKLSGTSFAAPVVSGAIALVAQAFPMLTPEQMVLLLYTTADDLGPTGTDGTFGRGRLNIGRAFQPVGTVRLASSMEPVPASIGSLPAAAGDAARQGSLKATILDDFMRPFDVNLATTMVEIAEAGPLSRSLAGGTYSHSSTILGPFALAFTIDDSRLLNGSLGSLRLSHEENRSARVLAASAIAKLTNSMSLAFGIGQHASSLQEGLSRPYDVDFLLSEKASQRSGLVSRGPNSLVLQQSRNGWRLSASAERGSIATHRARGRGSDYAMFGFHIERQFRRGIFRVGVSRLQEPETMLGAKLGKLFGQQGSGTWFTDLDAKLYFDSNWSLGASARRGWTTLSSGRFVASAISMDVAKQGVLSADDAVKIRVSQPLRIERGSIGMIVPTSWDYRTQTFTEASRQLNLSPSGRELFMEVGYLRSSRGGSASFHLYHRTDAGHVDNAPNDLGAAIRVNFKL